MDHLETSVEENDDDQATCVDVREYEDLTKEHCIPLKDGLYIRELINNKGAIFETVEPPRNDEVDNNTYFADESILQYLNPTLLDEDSDCTSDEDYSEQRSPFEKLGRKMKDISGGDGGVLKKVINEGTGEIVSEGSTITVHYGCFLEYADEPYDSTFIRRKPLQITLESKNETCTLIYGLELGVRTMRAHERARFIVHPNYAYGSLGCYPRIPGNAFILFEVELLEVLDYSAAAELSKLSIDEQRMQRFEKIRSAAKAEHAAGNSNFKKKSYVAAIKNYKRGIKLLDLARLSNKDEEVVQQKLLKNLYSNLSLCYRCTNELPKVLSYCRKVLEIEQEDVKALYRFGCAKTALAEYETAFDYLIRAQRRDPSSKEIKVALLDLDARAYEMRNREKIIYGKMFQTSSANVHAASPKKLTASDSEAKKVPDVANDQRFKDHVGKLLDKFSRDKEITQITYPGELSSSELNQLREIAFDLGFKVSVGNSVITISKPSTSD